MLLIKMQNYFNEDFVSQEILSTGKILGLPLKFFGDLNSKTDLE